MITGTKAPSLHRAGRFLPVVVKNGFTAVKNVQVKIVVCRLFGKNLPSMGRTSKNLQN
jgi:hypothetical protein